MKKIITMCFLLISAGNCFGQQVTFQKTYEAGFGTTVYQNTDGGYIITGALPGIGNNSDVCLIRTDIYGNLLWARSFGDTTAIVGLSVQQTTDGGFIIAGYSQLSTLSTGNRFLLIKTDANGNLLWQKFFGPGDYDFARSVQQTTDGGYIITGSVYSLGAGYSDVYLIKTDSNGDSLWTRTFGGPDNDEGNCVRQTADGGYIITGFTWSFGTVASDIYLIKTDANGDTLWTKTLGSPGPRRDVGNAIQQTADGGYIITGTRSYGTTDFNIYLIKTDSIGNSIWAKQFVGVNNDFCNSVLQTTDGGYIVAGSTSTFPPGPFTMKTDLNGDTLWTKSYGIASQSAAYCIQNTADGGYVLAGYITDSSQKVYLIKTDSMGNSGCNEGSAPFSVVSQTMLQTNPATIVSSGGNVAIPVFIDSIRGTVNTLCATVGVQSEIQNPQSAITISPNPTTNHFTITFPNTINKGVIEIYNVLGEKIFKEDVFNVSQKEILINNINAGIYFVKVRDGEKEYCKKLVIK